MARKSEVPVFTHLETFEVQNELGEGIVWDHTASALMWTDILGRKLFRVHWPAKQIETFDLPYRLGSMALTDFPGTIIAAFDRGFARYDYESGNLRWLVQPEMGSGLRFNDGRVDREGRFVAGTMVEDAEAAGGTHLGKLYRLQHDNSLSILIEGIGISNALCWSPDGRTMYHADTTRGAVNAYTYGETVRFERVVRQFRREEGGPDGATVDAAGNIWVAMWGTGRVVCLSSDGVPLAEFAVAARQPTCPSFCGTDLSALAVTSAWKDISPDQRVSNLNQGDIFLVETNIQGLPENIVSL